MTKASQPDRSACLFRSDCRSLLDMGSDDIAWLQLFRDVSRPGGALQSHIRQMLVAAVETARLSPGRRLPSSRRLATLLGVARNTVTAAYEQLVEDGVLISQERSGVFVARPSGVPQAQGALRSNAPPWQPDFAMRPSGLHHISKPRDWQSYPYPFLFGQFDPGLFPIQSWRESVANASSVASVNDWAGDLIDEDDAELVGQLCARVLPRRAVWAAPDEVMITIGAQQALYLALRLLVRPGASVAMENPGYPDARHMVRLAGGQPHFLAVDGEGARPDGGLSDCRVAVLTPGHHCPTTVPGARDVNLPGGLPHALRQQAHHGQRRHGLAAAGLAHQRQRLTGRQFDVQPLQHRHGRATAGELHPQSLHRQRGRPRHRRRSRGSSASLMPSPSRLTASTARKIAAPGNVTAHQASCM